MPFTCVTYQDLGSLSTVPFKLTIQAGPSRLVTGQAVVVSQSGKHFTALERVDCFN